MSIYSDNLNKRNNAVLKTCQLSHDNKQPDEYYSDNDRDLNEGDEEKLEQQLNEQKEKSMLVKTCSCHKDNLVCIKTGFWFGYNLELRTGDLFLCSLHKTVAIHGVPSGSLRELRKTDNISMFSGLLTNPDSSDTYQHSMYAGYVRLCEADILYIEKYHDLSTYNIDEEEE